MLTFVFKCFSYFLTSIISLQDLYSEKSKNYIWPLIKKFIGHKVETDIVDFMLSVEEMHRHLRSFDG